MKLSIQDVCAVLGKTERQVRYSIRKGDLKGTKKGRQWFIDSADLPLDGAQRQNLEERLKVARQAFEKGLEPATKAIATDETQAREQQANVYSVTRLTAFQTGTHLLVELDDSKGSFRRLADRLETELIPKIGGLIAAHEKRRRRRRFDHFGGSAKAG